MTQTVRTDDGIAIEFNVYGSGPLTLVFLHGWGNAASAWEDFITTRMSFAGLRCVTVSYRGHGGSDAAKTGYTHERFRAILSQLPTQWERNGSSWLASAWLVSSAVIWRT